MNVKTQSDIDTLRKACFHKVGSLIKVAEKTKHVEVNGGDDEEIEEGLVKDLANLAVTPTSEAASVEEQAVTLSGDASDVESMGGSDLKLDFDLA